jgi:hypothetical protein
VTYSKTEDGVKDVMGLDVVLDSVEPLGVMVSDANKLLPTFEVKSPQEFAVTPVIRECVKEGVEVGNFLVEVGEDSKQAKLFVDDGELVVGEDSFFEGKDLFPVHVVVGVPTCVKVRQDLVLDVSKSGSIDTTKQDLIKIKSRSSGESCATSPH